MPIDMEWMFSVQIVVKGLSKEYFNEKVVFRMIKKLEDSMRKKLLILIQVFVLSFILSGCGSNDLVGKWINTGQMESIGFSDGGDFSMYGTNFGKYKVKNNAINLDISFGGETATFIWEYAIYDVATLTLTRDDVEWRVFVSIIDSKPNVPLEGTIWGVLGSSDEETIFTGDGLLIWGSNYNGEYSVKDNIVTMKLSNWEDSIDVEYEIAYRKILILYEDGEEYMRYLSMDDDTVDIEELLEKELQE